MNISLRNVHYSIITEGDNGIESYGTPKRAADAIMIDLTLNRRKTPIYADDKLRYYLDEFTDGAIRANMLDFIPEAQEDLFGVTRDANGAIVTCAEDEPKMVAFGFESDKRQGVSEFIWLYRVKFSPPNRTFNTKGESTTVNTPTTEGNIFQRIKPRYDNEHPIGVSLSTDGTAATDAILEAWFDSVYEPVDPNASQTPAEPAETTPGTTG